MSKANVTNDEKLKIRESVLHFNTTHASELFSIIKKDTSKYTVNKNGVFLNLKNVDDKLMLKIKQYVDYVNETNNTFVEKKMSVKNEKNL